MREKFLIWIKQVFCLHEEMICAPAFSTVVGVTKDYVYYRCEKCDKLLSWYIPD